MIRLTSYLTSLTVVIALASCFDSNGVGPGDPGWKPYPPLTQTPFHENLPADVRDATVFQAGDTIYFFGGRLSNGTAVSSVFAYDLRTHAWIERDTMPTPRYQPAVASIGEMVFVIGGRNAELGATDGPLHRTIERYDPKADRWESLPPIDAEAFDGSEPTLITAAGNQIYAVSTLRTARDAWICASSDGVEWSSRQLPLKGSIDPTLMSDGKRLFLITDESQFTYRLYEYDTRTHQPAYGAMPLNEMHGDWNRWVAFNGDIYKINGFMGGGNGITVYDVADGSWVWQDVPYNISNHRKYLPIVADRSRGVLYFFAPPQLRVGFFYDVSTGKFRDRE